MYKTHPTVQCDLFKNFSRNVRERFSESVFFINLRLYSYICPHGRGTGDVREVSSCQFSEGEIHCSLLSYNTHVIIKILMHVPLPVYEKFPRVAQVGYLCLIAVMLVARTYADVWIIQNGTAIEGSVFFSIYLYMH